MSHRALIFGALAQGQSEFAGLLAADDVASTAAVLGQLGVRIDGTARSTTTVAGRGLSFTPPREPLQCGNAGTCMRLMAGALVATNTAAMLTGDASLLSRPMDPLVEALAGLGANVRCTRRGPRGEGLAPIEVGSRGALVASRAHLPVPSAQLATALMLASLGATGTLTLTGLAGARDHSGRLLQAMGVQFGAGEHVGPRLTLAAGQRLTPLVWRVPGDLSSAAFWLAAAAIVPGSDLVLDDVSLNESRLAFVYLLRRMGALVTIERSEPAVAGPGEAGRHPPPPDEPIGSIRLESRPLRAVALAPHEAAGLIDELPLVAAIASYAAGTTCVRGAAQLRVKESDRIAAMTAELLRLGAQIEALPDGFVVTGTTALGAVPGTVLDAHGDHRVAMALAVASLGASGPIYLRGGEAAAISYRGFWPAWRQMFAPTARP